jgi:hypothetical protein
MNGKNNLFKIGEFRFALGVVLLATLTGCVGYIRGPRAEVYVAPPVVETGVVVEDDYVYYPGYDVYYNSSRRQYAYLEGGAWVSRPEPRGVSIDVLLASPSVHMDFHDSPANHHAEMVQRYPRNWKPSGSPPVRQENRKEDKRDENDRR